MALANVREVAGQAWNQAWNFVEEGERQVINMLPHSWKDGVDFTRKTSGAKHTFKLMYLVPDLIRNANLPVTLGPVTDAISSAGRTCNAVVVGVIELPKKCDKLNRDIWPLVQTVATGTILESVEPARDVVADLCDLFASVQKDIETFGRSLISSKAALALKQAGGVLLSLGMSCLIWNKVEDIGHRIYLRSDIDQIGRRSRDVEKGETEEQYKAAMAEADQRAAVRRQCMHQVNRDAMASSMLFVARSASYLALGLLTCATAIFAIEIAPLAFTIAALAAVFFSIAFDFHKVHMDANNQERSRKMLAENYDLVKPKE